MAFPRSSFAQIRSTIVPSPTVSPEAEVIASPTPGPDLTQKTVETLGPLEELLKNQKLGPVWPSNPIKYAIRSSVEAGIPVNMIVLLLLLPMVATVIAAARHLIGLRGFGIFLPAALSVVFVATGPIVGIILFFLIITVSWLVRSILRRLKINLQYLPKAAFLLWAVSLGVLGLMFLSPLYKIPGIENVSIFPVLILALLAEDFTRISLGKSFKTAFTLTTETMLLALLSYFVLTTQWVQSYALLNPEKLLIGIGIVDFVLGKYVGLRIMEIWRFKKLIKS
ncbi:MAG: 7TM domain-containing protein [Patescibacteria group bacterium]